MFTYIYRSLFGNGLRLSPDLSRSVTFIEEFVPDEDTVAFLNLMYPERTLARRDDPEEYQWYAAKRELVTDLIALYEARLNGE